jgi:hypothetical protein
LGGFGGDSDMLFGVARYKDDGDLDRILSAFGYSGSPPLEETSTYLGIFVIAGVSVTVSMAKKAREIQLSVGLYITEKDISDTCAFEVWLDDNKIPMVENRRRAAPTPR